MSYWALFFLLIVNVLINTCNWFDLFCYDSLLCLHLCLCLKLSPPVLQLLDVIVYEETIFNVVRSVTKNGRSIILTTMLAVILIYLFSIVGFLFFREDFQLEVDDSPLAIADQGNTGYFPYRYVSWLYVGILISMK